MLTTRQCKPLLNAVKGTAKLALEYEGQPSENVTHADKHELTGRKVCMVVKGRTRYERLVRRNHSRHQSRRQGQEWRWQQQKCVQNFLPARRRAPGRRVAKHTSQGRVWDDRGIWTGCAHHGLHGSEAVQRKINTILTTVHKKKKPKNGVFTSLKAAALQADAEQFEKAYQKELNNWRDHNAYDHITPGPDDEIVRPIQLLSRKIDELKEATHQSNLWASRSTMTVRKAFYTSVSRSTSASLCNRTKSTTETISKLQSPALTEQT
jgi:hypothetical protein